jgi:universal stress protein E
VEEISGILVIVDPMLRAQPAILHVDDAVAADYLPRVAADCRADIVVMGAISRSGVRRVLVGSTAERVPESLPCGVLVVRPANFAQNLPF